MASSGTYGNAGDTRAAGRSTLETAALAVGAVFLLVGVLGFIPGITTNYGDMTFAGHESGAELLGVFHVSILHNVVHLLFGVAGLALGRTWSATELARFASAVHAYQVAGALTFVRDGFILPHYQE
jgi:hypothetical protein